MLYPIELRMHQWVMEAKPFRFNIKRRIHREALVGAADLKQLYGTSETTRKTWIAPPEWLAEKGYSKVKISGPGVALV